jgi:hypothetical protein
MPNAHRLTSFSIAEDGSLSDRKIFAQLKKHHTPDGICLDEEIIQFSSRVVAQFKKQLYFKFPQKMRP